MIVYHFISAEFALKALRDRRLKIARLNELNNPLEFCAADFAASDDKNRLEAFRYQMNQRFGVVCFTENYDDPVLWGRYADGHRGVALVFEIPDNDAIRMNYRSENLARDVATVMRRGGFAESDLSQWVSNQFPSLHYENEIRMVCTLSDHFCQMGRTGEKIYFETLSLDSFGTDSLKLVGLVRGIRCDLKPTDIAGELLAVDTLPVYDTYLNSESFRVISDKTYPVSGLRSFSACCFRI